MPKLIGLSEETARRLIELLERDAAFRNDGTDYVPQAYVSSQRGFTHVRITSTTQTSGRYPGKLLEFDPELDTFVDYSDIWVIEINDEVLSTTPRYEASRYGEANGRLVFAVKLDTSSGGGGTPAGSNTQVQYNNAGAFGASADFTYSAGTVQLRSSTTSSVVVTTENILNASAVNFVRRRAAGADTLTSDKIGENIYTARIGGTDTKIGSIEAFRSGTGCFWWFVSAGTTVMAVGSNSWGIFGGGSPKLTKSLVIPKTATGAYGTNEQEMLDYHQFYINDLYTILAAFGFITYS